MPVDADRRDNAAGRAAPAHPHTAQVLIEATDLPFAEVAFAAGFADVRQLTDTVRAAFGTTPAELRRTAPAHSGATGTATLALRLPVRTPFAFEGVLGHLAACAVPGCEEVRDGAFRRTLRLPHGHGIVSLTPSHDHVGCLLTLADLRDTAAAITRCRRLLDLDADPAPVIEALAADPELRPAVIRAPGQRIPRTVDEAELAVRVVLSQQVSIKAARTHARRLLLGYGEEITDPDGGLTHVFPSVQRLVDLDPAQLALPQARRRTLVGLVAALAEGTITLDVGCDWERARHDLLRLPGIGPWTVEVIAMRGLGDPDAFPATDLGVRVAARQLGLPDGGRALTERATRWRPWRSYATQHLWTMLDHDVNQWPPNP
ncbi:DNA-3-methyladenine glycosylase 2 [Mycobacterium sp. M1]|uniref:DNA-3-methyladenine glycosylase II n=1 Tax=Mycolicibacter acidiphilus TaxID=2835306 RepID=A0ABS5RQC9_9MYCO|nr:DNA-3-methyladenine glycosylase 2 [Mycolicibacter acidiphilus]